MRKTWWNWFYPSPLAGSLRLSWRRLRGPLPTASKRMTAERKRLNQQARCIQKLIYAGGTDA